MIGIKRSTGVSGSFFKAKVYLNGTEVAKIKEGQQIELEIPDDEAEIYVQQFENRSNEVLVKNGQVVEVTNSFWYYFNFFLIFTAILLVNVFMSTPYRIVGSILIILLAIALPYFKNGLDLKVIYPQE